MISYMIRAISNVSTNKPRVQTDAPFVYLHIVSEHQVFRDSTRLCVSLDGDPLSIEHNLDYALGSSVGKSQSPVVIVLKVTNQARGPCHICARPTESWHRRRWAARCQTAATASRLLVARRAGLGLRRGR